MSFLSSPNGWTRIGGTATGALRFADYLPSGRTPTDPANGSWTEKITLEQLAGKPLPAPLDFLVVLRADHLKGCSKGSHTPIAAAEENGYPTAVAMLVCPKLEVIDAGQITLIKVIQGDASLQTITRAIRARPWSSSSSDEHDEAAASEAGAAQPSPIDPALIGGTSVRLRAISACNSAMPDHPCPGTAGA